VKGFWHLLRTDRLSAALAGTAALLLLLNAAAIPALDLPLRGRAAAREEALYTLQGEIRSLRRAAGGAEAARRLEGEISRLRGSFPPRREVVALVRDLSARAASMRLKTGGIDYRPTDMPGEGLLKLSVAMGVEGRYADVRRFLDGLEGTGGRLAITHLAATGRPADGQVSVRLTLTAYFRTEGPRAESPRPATGSEETS
jgi:hypothetical protein